MNYKNSLKKAFIITIISLSLISCNDSSNKDIDSSNTNVIEEVNDSDTTKNELEKNLLNNEDYDMLNKLYDEFTVSERQRFEEIIKIYPNMSEEEKEKINENFKRLSEEKLAFDKTKGTDESNASYELNPENGKIYEYGPGSYGMGNNINIPEAGNFNFAIKGAGNIKIIDRDENIYIDEKFNNQDTYHMIQGFLFDGWTLDIGDGLEVQMQLNKKVFDGSNNTLSRGKWNIGQNIKPGKYKIYYNISDLVNDSGKINIINDANTPVGGIMIKSSDTQKDENYFTYDLEEGQVLEINGISKVLLSTFE